MNQQISRNEFFREFFSRLKEEFTGDQLTNRQQNFILPPGASSMEEYLETCSQCNACVSACPHESIRICWDEQSPLMGYPVIVPRETPCYRCADFPCAASCPTPALDSDRVHLSLSVAMVVPQRCLSFNGHFCQSCVSSCPETGAIQRYPDGQIRIDASKCSGCGICESVCPTEPAAIRMKMKASATNEDYRRVIKNHSQK